MHSAADMYDPDIVNHMNYCGYIYTYMLVNVFISILLHMRKSLIYSYIIQFSEALYEHNIKFSQVLAKIGYKCYN